MGGDRRIRDVEGGGPRGDIHGDLVSGAGLISNRVNDCFKVICKWVAEETLLCEASGSGGHLFCFGRHDAGAVEALAVLAVREIHDNSGVVPCVELCPPSLQNTSSRRVPRRKVVLPGAPKHMLLWRSQPPRHPKFMDSGKLPQISRKERNLWEFWRNPNLRVLPTTDPATPSSSECTWGRFGVPLGSICSRCGVHLGSSKCASSPGNV